MMTSPPPAAAAASVGDGTSLLLTVQSIPDRPVNRPAGALGRAPGPQRSAGAASQTSTPEPGRWAGGGGLAHSGVVCATRHGTNECVELIVESFSETVG